MFWDGLPCLTDGCEGLAADGRAKCETCHDRNGYPEGYSRKRDDAWFADEIRNHPIEGPGCNSHPVTPRPDFCLLCKRLLSAPAPASDDSQTLGHNA
jgi:hypothetical protein